MGFLNRRFRCSEKLVCDVKRRKSFFHDLFLRSVTWEYTRLQGVTGVTGGYKGFQGVGSGCKGLEGVTRCYKG